MVFHIMICLALCVIWITFIFDLRVDFDGVDVCDVIEIDFPGCERFLLANISLTE